MPLLYTEPPTPIPHPAVAMAYVLTRRLVHRGARNRLRAIVEVVIGGGEVGDVDCKKKH